MNEQMGKRFIRVAVLLLLLLLTAAEAEQDFKRRTAQPARDKELSADTEAVEYRQYDSTGDIVGLAETDGENQVCQTDYTIITFYDGSYYYQSAADYFYLYKSDENGENQECLAQQVPGEIYVMGEWVYFTNVSAGGSVYRIRQDGNGMEEIFDRRVSRFVLMGDTFYFLSEGNVYSWTEERGAELIYEGDCEWIFAKDQAIYLDITKAEEAKLNSYTVELDAQGKIMETYDGWHRYKILAGVFFYYIEDGAIMCESAETGEVTEIARAPLLQYEEHWTHYEIWEDCFYLLSRRYDDENYCYQIRLYRYEFASGTWSMLHSKEVCSAALLLYWPGVFFVINGNIFFKEYAMDGEGELWHCIDPETGEYAVFEDMGNFQVAVLNHDDLFAGATDRTQPYLAEDGVYQAEKEDDEGNVIRTDIRIPQFNDKIPAYERINQNIQEDAECFYEEQMEFAESIRNASEEGEGNSGGSWSYEYVYADSQYISIVYWKFIGRNVVTDVKCDEYEVRLYSAETGEEIEIWDLFTVSKTEVLLRFSFAIRKTIWGTWLLHDDYDVRSVCEGNFILTDNGIDVFFVGHSWTKVYHVEVSYEEWEDILVHTWMD